MPLRSEIDYLEFNRNLRETYRRYIYTANMISDQEPALRDEFWDRIDGEFGIFNGPLLHCTPSYKTSCSIEQLVEGKGAIALSDLFMRLPQDQFDISRPLYKHQVEAFEILGRGSNLIVATGTGSGKTECFLMPILDDIFQNPLPGLRAILIYPMNALADDQLGRLRKLLADFPEVSFGRYTGDTPWDSEDPSDRDGLPSNERYTRKEIRDNPPHILLTNFAMLEYLLLRPRDADIFQHHHLKFLVLDEAHSYAGAQGIEISLLLRRVREYLVGDADSIQFVLTSATLGDGEEAHKSIAAFGSHLTGSDFDSDSVLVGETVDEFAEPLIPFPSSETMGRIGAVAEGFEAWTQALLDPVELTEKLDSFGISCSAPADLSAARMLYDLFGNSEPLNKVYEMCKSQPAYIEELCPILGLDTSDCSLRAVQWLVTMGAYARRSPDSAPLLPTRLHFFTRGLAGATICLNEDCSGKEGHMDTQWGAFYLEDRNVCEHCQSKLLPLSTCVHCGLPVCRIFIADGKWKTSCPPHLSPDPRLVTWVTDLEEEKSDEEESDERFALLCLSCGLFHEEETPPNCCAKKRIIRVRLLPPVDSEGNLRTCPRCQGTSGGFPSVLRSFRTAEEAPTAVIGETLVRNLPFDPDDPEKADLPAHGRNLLVFSDSRQRAAFYAPYFAQTTLESAYLDPIRRAIEKAEEQEGRAVTFEEVARQYLHEIRDMPVVVMKETDENGIEAFNLLSQGRLRSAQRSDLRKEAEMCLYRDFCSSPRKKATLRGTAIAALTIDYSEDELINGPRRLPLLFQESEEKGWAIIQALIEILVSRTAVEFPFFMTSRQIISGPQAVTYHLSKSGKVNGRQVVRWNPYQAPSNRQKRAISESRQLSLLAKFLHLDAGKDSQTLDGLFTDIWDFMKESLLVEYGSGPGEFRVDPNLLQLTSKARWSVCEKCGSLTSLGSLGVCVAKSCDGSLVPLLDSDFERRFERNHYRQRYFLPALPLEVKEHTAQLTNKFGKQYQEQFMKGEVNVLSSSTTFEMGVDVGALKAVLLRNVPPTTSSYIQRAGRAGRRKDGISVVVTYARNAPHDQFHYQSPRSIILGHVPVPHLELVNRPLTQRHCNSALLGYFLRSVQDIDKETLDRLTIQTFFLEQHSGKTLVERFGEWLSDDAQRASMEDVLRVVIPQESDLTPVEAIRTAIEDLVQSAEGSVLVLKVLEPLKRFEEQHSEVREQMNDDGIAGAQRTRLARSLQSLERLIDQFKKERLIDFLSSCSWLPGYAFPQDVVKLLVRQVDFSSRMRLQRDREIGISEYAPGAEIVADGHLFASGGVWLNSKEPDIRQYARCPQCRKIDTYLETEKPERKCSRCGTRLTGKFLPRMYLKPDGFTTLVNTPVEAPGRSRRPAARTSEVFLLEGAAPDEFQEHPIRGISYAEKKGGRLFLANSGYDFKGYFVCRKCGRGFDAPPTNRLHETPWGSKCSSRTLKLDLAHEITTDLLQLHFENCAPPAPDIRDRSFWLSFLSAFLNGASDALHIDASDLGGTYHGWTEESFIGELVIYDRIPGGAGHIGRIIDNLDLVLGKTYVRVADCKCPDVEASCYACLRNYGNQFYWEELRRKAVIDWLAPVLGRR